MANHAKQFSQVFFCVLAFLFGETSIRFIQACSYDFQHSAVTLLCILALALFMYICSLLQTVYCVGVGGAHMLSHTRGDQRTALCSCFFSSAFMWFWRLHSDRRTCVVHTSTAGLRATSTLRQSLTG